MDLEDIRRDIDILDQALVDILNKRMSLVDKVAIYKFIEDIPVENKDREVSIKESLSGRNDLVETGLIEVFEKVFQVSKSRQEKNIKNYSKIKSSLIKNKKNIILIGMPGCGKSTLGNKLAKFLERDFLDTDELIYEEVGLRPKEIIEKLGEVYFREIETEILKKIDDKKGIVVATGGGILVRKENYQYIKKMGNCVFYINRSIDLLDRKDRPLSKDGKSSIEKLYEERHNQYIKACDYLVDNEKISDTIFKIVCLYSQLK
nr:shikimate kinase [uncultured Peptostreptococcus sp.]